MVKIRCVLMIALAAAALPGCKIVKTLTPEEKAAAEAKTAFNPDAKVEAVWQSQAIPYFQKHAGDLKDVTTAITASPDQAGQKYGNPRRPGGAPWTYAVKLNGKITKADTASRAATLEVDIDGDGKADAKIQIGPVIRGTALRDALDFIDFNDFKNQIEWAQFGKSFNEKVNATVLNALPKTGLEGKSVTVTGAFALPASGQIPLITPAELTLGASS